jgi:hypothetical protein
MQMREPGTVSRVPPSQAAREPGLDR